MNKIKDRCLANIKNTKLNILNCGFNYSDFVDINNNKYIKIDTIYINIIKSLIEGKNFDNSFDVLKQLDFESIIITKEMFQKLKQILNDKENYIKDFIIINIFDLIDEKKINFNYILLKYILKNSYYIYQIPFLLRTRAIIISIINSNLRKLLYLDMSIEIKEKMEYLLEVITDSKYYFLKYINYQLKEILNYYKQFLYESKKEDIISIENHINKKGIIDYKKYLPDFNIVKKINKIIPIILYLFSQNINNKEKPETVLNEFLNNLEKYEEIVVERYSIKMNNEEKQIIMNFLMDSKNQEILIKIVHEKTYNSFLDIKNIFDNKKSLEEKRIESENQNIENNIKKPKINNTLNPMKKLQNNSTKMISKGSSKKKEKGGSEKEIVSNLKENDEINQNSNKRNPNQNQESNNQLNSSYSKISFIEYFSQIKNDKNQSMNTNLETLGSKLKSEIKNETIESKYYSIIEKKEIIYNIQNEYKKEIENNQKENKKIQKETEKNHKEKEEKKYPKIKTTEFIKEINNNFLLIGGINSNIDILDQSYKKIYTLSTITKKINNIVYSINENKKNLSKNKFEMIFCCNNDVCNLFEFNYEDNNIKSVIEGKYIDQSGLYSIELSNNESNYIILGKDGVFMVSDLSSKIINGKIFNIYKNPSYGGILIDKDILAFVIDFNLLNKNQKTKLIFYNLTSKKIVKNVEFKYQFNLSQNSLSLMEYRSENNKEKGNKILLCACKKYIRGQKNGILLLNCNFYENKEIVEQKFLETKNFEPNCFCQLSIYKSKEKQILNQNLDIKETNYFFIGGFDLIRLRGTIKLFKLIYNNKNNIIEIKYIEDVLFLQEKEKYYKSPISCIIQTKKTGEILISFLNGNICSFTSPKNDFLEKYENENNLNRIELYKE